MTQLWIVEWTLKCNKPSQEPVWYRFIIKNHLLKKVSQDVYGLILTSQSLSVLSNLHSLRDSSSQSSQYLQLTKHLGFSQLFSFSLNPLNQASFKFQLAGKVIIFTLQLTVRTAVSGLLLSIFPGVTRSRYLLQQNWISFQWLLEFRRFQWPLLTIVQHWWVAGPLLWALLPIPSLAAALPPPLLSRSPCSPLSLNICGCHKQKHLGQNNRGERSSPV